MYGKQDSFASVKNEDSSSGFLGCNVV